VTEPAAAPPPPGRSSRIRFAALAAGLAAGLALVLIAGAVEVSSTPRFCGSCHVMEPYYASWKTSSHRQVACVECHIAPGVTAEFRKKYEALSMVARYFTGTYGTKPWTEVDDAACLRCHERRLIEGREDFRGIHFDHTPHLTEMRRGKKLRCTSCHSQIVQGSHITVTSSTCILCHFKGEEPGQGTARCTVCHAVPEKVVKRGGMEFDHGDVARFAMDCSWCHVRPAGNEGRVPKERCMTCHNEPTHLAAAGDVDRMHRAHVSEHKVDCLHCHLEIEHGAAADQHAERGECATCHGGGHSPQRDLYAGMGGRGVESRPSPMFLAGVRCEGCHFISTTGNGGARVERAGDISCMSCHGPTYRAIFQSWQRALGERTAAVRAALREIPAAPGRGESRALEDARANLTLVERAHGIHNVGYALALLDKAYELQNEERQQRGLPRRAAPWPRAGQGSPCLQCHIGIEVQSGSFSGRTYAHRPHLAAGLDCASCHRPHQERPQGEIVRFGEEGCDACHHRDLKSAPRVADCAGCHGDVTKKTFKTGRGEFSHAFHLEAAGGECAVCHSLVAGKAPAVNPKACADCHG
jgi:nitrate/TMAO reductase-like tetraheme cytochrome c subunit